jgi:CBS domain-containing protein
VSTNSVNGENPNKFSVATLSVHLSVAILVALFTVEFGLNGRSTLYVGISYILALAVHEMGHSTMVRVFNLRRRKVEIYPFGGVWIDYQNDYSTFKNILLYLSGSFLNLFFAGYIWFQIFEGKFPSINMNLTSSLVFWPHFFIGFVNLLPISPLDMGNLLQKIFSNNNVAKDKNYKLFTGEITAVICAIICVVYDTITGFFFFIFLFTLTLKETFILKAISASIGIKIGEVFRKSEFVDTFQYGLQTKSALQIAEKSFQEQFPVIQDNIPVGIVTRDSLLRSQVEDGGYDYVSSIMSKDFITANIHDSLDQVLRQTSIDSDDIIIVTEEHFFKGVVILSKLSKSLMIRSILPEDI